jgi:hypothetical protein
MPIAPAVKKELIRPIIIPRIIKIQIREIIFAEMLEIKSEMISEEAIDEGFVMAVSINGINNENKARIITNATIRIEITTLRIKGTQMFRLFFQVLKPPLHNSTISISVIYYTEVYIKVINKLLD